MLDTIILTIGQGKFKVENIRRFGLENKKDILVFRGFRKFENNPTSREKRDGIYKPRITLNKRYGEYDLRIEFSAPKLIFGNNLDELEEADFENVVNALREALQEMGVSIGKEDLQNAKSTFHPSKNIILQDGYTTSFVIKELSKAKISTKLDVSKTSFRNEGELLQIYANSSSLVVYDKKKDLEKPEKRAVDKDHNHIQKFLCEAIKKQEILRIEVRLANRTKLKTVLKEIGHGMEPTLKNIFDAELCKDILQHYWNNAFGAQNVFLFDMKNGPKKILRDVIKSRPSIRPKEAIYLVGLKLLSKDDGGIRELRRLVEGVSTRRTWYRISEGLRLLDNDPRGAYHGWMMQIANELDAFSPLKLST